MPHGWKRCSRPHEPLGQQGENSAKHFLGARFQHPPVHAPHCMCGGIVWAREVRTKASNTGQEIQRLG
jgi:hypothetical protein